MTLTTWNVSNSWTSYVQMFCATGSQLDVLVVIVIERTEPINIELDLYN